MPSNEVDPTTQFEIIKKESESTTHIIRCPVCDGDFSQDHLREVHGYDLFSEIGVNANEFHRMQQDLGPDLVVDIRETLKKWRAMR